MKLFNNFRRKLLPVAALAAVIAAGFAGCTKVDDTLGGNLIPDNQQMKAGYVELLGEGLNPKKYVETRLFQSDSLIGSNISYGYFGTNLNDTLGERKAGFLSQMINYYKVDEGYFGYEPIFDSAQIMLKITSIGRDSLTEQTFAIYEITSNDYITKKPVAANKSQADTTFYINFDPSEPKDASGNKYADAVYDSSKKLFTFKLGGEGTTPSTATAVTLEPTDAGRDYIKRLMLQEGEYKDKYSIYDPENLKQWVEAFKGLYICPDPDTQIQQDGKKETGTIFATSLEYSGLAVFGRNRVESDPTLIKDTIGMVYYFYESGTEFGNVSVNSIKHDYDKATSTAKIDIAKAREVNPDGSINEDRDLNSRVYVEGMGGVVTEMTFAPEFFAKLEREISREEEKAFKTMAFGQVRMSVYFNKSDYSWEDLVPTSTLIDEMNAFPSRLGLYTNFKTLTPISDYAYTYEQNYNTTLSYGGKINRSRGCYVLDITGYTQQLWNSYIKAKEAAGAVFPDIDLEDSDDAGDRAEFARQYAAWEAGIDWTKVANRTVYIGPEAYSLYSSSFGVLQGMAADGNNAPIRFDIFYNLIK